MKTWDCKFSGALSVHWERLCGRLSFSMMKFHQFALVGLGGASVIAGLIYLAGASRRATLDGEITRVRTLGVERNASVAIVDFRATNESDVLFMAGDREVAVIDEQGARYDGAISSSFDLKQLFRYFPALGAMSHEPYVEGIKLRPGQSVAGMLAARFALSKEDLDHRREIILRIHDADGSLTELRSASVK